MHVHFLIKFFHSISNISGELEQHHHDVYDSNNDYDSKWELFEFLVENLKSVI